MAGRGDQPGTCNGTNRANQRVTTIGFRIVANNLREMFKGLQTDGAEICSANPQVKETQLTADKTARGSRVSLKPANIQSTVAVSNHACVFHDNRR
jgi:hypothetical protein